ncbi:MAG: hypothetical protein A3I26_02005 [Candidatus Yanofskybacteria bacterium RIFCSPLOWO2_02_FULL_43_10]|uniref:Peptidase S49 domain-containing protein n=1 Tax=Candidatus Yanofskybacteria bacterium RIFCSPLOWO2_12_FULL_43_11b TaxID=1802710 RepID=A0A1F8H8T3_9BACT|nr:MAG: hypothetical protein A2742_02770 [Candidatus Yanofskybacteria bacterium RIFCSPHIGHO2_01_FULL_43_32]OGN12059.1 MAG: hypothetical protein A3C69_00535 [Candidatus Yanofskybacteria bacterium RIFCSPHIGHO2_02_FULL_43_12]OGN17566.1 MAG: hypothetical protein A3E34_03335 [Candidatus Yanofskybacteria bacterium RIFCSPHIGHO2_12_FULL_43_11]OGN25079.1 MAG: hypothetical protein A2923_01725 [Candidatus Yanofskybacteria bacterium RIFCSPLOWO2_01_FULL_43_46]OGN28734.1 MAG: hypothetical protein A3I26_02005
MVDTPQPIQKENNLHKLAKATVVFRNKPTLLLNLDHVMPMSVMLVAKELHGKNIPDLDVILHTPGGHIESAYKIVKLLRKHAKKINVIVPSFAKSAGTLICLSGETLMLSTISELGPLDVQIAEHQEGDIDTYKSALNGYKALEQIQNHAVENLDVATQLILQRTGNRMRLQDIIKLAIDFSGNTSGCLYNQIHPKTIAESARYLDIGEQYGVRILERYMGWDKIKATKVIHHLVYDYPSHEFIIDKEELSKMGFAVQDIPSELEIPLETSAALLQGQDIKFFDIINPGSSKVKLENKNTKKNEKDSKKAK